MKDVGTNTPISTSAIAISAPETSSIVSCAASRGVMPFSSISRSIFSTTTIASSTTMPIASTMPNSERLLSEKPSSDIAANDPTSETGIAMIGISAARQLCRKISTTSATRMIASNSVCSTAAIDSCDVFRRVVGDAVCHARREAACDASSSSARTASAVLSAFDPGSCVMRDGDRRLAATDRR